MSDMAPALRLSGIKAFYGTAQALFGVDLEVPAGSVTVLLGRNGAGKSTTLKAAMGLVDVRAGQVSVGARDVTGVPSYKVARAGLGGMRERLAGQLSGGEQQMLTIARTLMGNPRIILLDEPSEGLAPVIVQQIAATIRTLSAEGLTVLLSEQNVRFATHVANRAAVIERGRILVEGPIAEIAADESVREAYLTP